MLLAFLGLAVLVLLALAILGLIIFAESIFDRDSIPPRITDEAIDAAEARCRARRGADDRDLDASRASAGRFSR